MRKSKRMIEKDLQSDSGNQLVTAVITTYKRPDTAKRAIQSALAQSYAPLEILVIEDGSDSDLESWCRQISSDRIIYRRHVYNRGLAASRNTGMRLAKGSYVAYLDDDDEWKPERIEKQMEVVARLSRDELASLGVISCGVEVRFPSKSRVSIVGHGNVGNLKDAIIKYGIVTPSSSFLFSKEALVRVGGFDEALPSSIDHDIWMSLANSGFYGYAVSEPLVINYDRSGRVTMMNDITTRIAGVKKYLEKWGHVHEVWYGREEGRRYRNHYFSEVISLLAAEKFWSRDFKNFRRAISEIYTYSDSYLFNTLILARWIVFTGMQRTLPKTAINALKSVRGAIRKLLPARN